MDWFTATFKPVFRFISLVLAYPMRWLEGLLHWLPWPATVAVVAIMAYAAKGWELSLFCVIAMAYMLIVGYWDESMSTLALVGISVPMSLALGFAMGLLAYQVPLGPAHHRAAARRHADGADLRLSGAHPDPVRRRPGGRHGGERHLCQPAHGQERHAGPAPRARRHHRERAHVGLQRASS